MLAYHNATQHQGGSHALYRRKALAKDEHAERKRKHGDKIYIHAGSGRGHAADAEPVQRIRAHKHPQPKIDDAHSRAAQLPTEGLPQRGG